MTVFGDGFISTKAFKICLIMNSVRYASNMLALAWNACCCSPYCKNEKRSRLIRDFACGASLHSEANPDKSSRLMFDVFCHEMVKPKWKK
jgi:hypothetical protein